MIILDTHAWVWWLTKPVKVGKKAARAIEKTDRIGVPAISVWEVAMKERSGKLRFDRPVEAWVEQALVEDARLMLIPLSPRIAVAAVGLEWEHRDPADRLIVATAVIHQCSLATADEPIRRAGLVRCVWD